MFVYVTAARPVEVTLTIALFEGDPAEWNADLDNPDSQLYKEYEETLCQSVSSLPFIYFALKYTTHLSNHTLLKSPQKVWNILKTLYFWSYLEMRFIVLYTIAKRVRFATSFVTIARFIADILPLRGGKVRKEMCQI